MPDPRYTVDAIRKAQEGPLSRGELFNGDGMRVSAADLKAIVTEHGSLRKGMSIGECTEAVTRAHPPRSRANRTTVYGGMRTPVMSHLGGYTDRTVGPSNPATQAAVDAVNAYGRVRRTSGTIYTGGHMGNLASMERCLGHFADRVDLDESLRSDSRFSPTSATICGQRTLWRAEVVRKSSSGTPFRGSMP
jgi:hypothetical protein